MEGSGRRRVAAVLATAALLAGCTPAQPPPPTPTGPAPTPARTITEASLPDADELAPPLGEGTVERYERGGRTVDALSVCQHPLAELSASQVLTRSFHTVYRRGQRPFPSSRLDAEPDTYVAVLQFASGPQAARADATYQDWVTRCRAEPVLPDGSPVLGEGFGWRSVPAPPATAQVAEVVYAPARERARRRYFESVGLTRLDDRLAVSVYVFCADESPFSTDPTDDEAGFSHPQLGLVALLGLTVEE